MKMQRDVGTKVINNSLKDGVYRAVSVFDLLIYLLPRFPFYVDLY